MSDVVGVTGGDFHAGLRVDDLDRTPEVWAAVDFMIDTAIERRAAWVELGGDLTDNNHPTADVTAGWIARLKRLDDAGIETHVTGGNHEAVSAPGRYWALTPLEAVGFRNVYFHKTPCVFVSPRTGLTMLFLPHVTRATAAAAGHAHPQSYVDEAAREFLDGFDESVNALVFCHYNLRAAKAGTEASMLRQSDLELPHWVPDHPRVAAVFAHHHHSPSRFGKVRVVGSPICTDFGDVDPNKGFLVVRARPDGAVKASRIRTPQAPLLEFELDFRTRKHAARVALVSKALDICREYPDAIVKLRVLMEEERLPELDAHDLQVTFEDMCKSVRGVHVVPVRGRQTRSAEQRPGLAPLAAVDLFLAERAPDGADRKRKLAAAILAGERPRIARNEAFDTRAATDDAFDRALRDTEADADRAFAALEEEGMSLDI